MSSWSSLWATPPAPPGPPGRARALGAQAQGGQGGQGFAGAAKDGGEKVVRGWRGSPGPPGPGLGLAGWPSPAVRDAGLLPVITGSRGTGGAGMLLMRTTPDHPLHFLMLRSLSGLGVRPRLAPACVSPSSRVGRAAVARVSFANCPLAPRVARQPKAAATASPSKVSAAPSGRPWAHLGTSSE